MKNTKKTEKENEIKVNKDFTTQKIDLEEFNKKSVSKQYKEIEQILKDAYDEETNILKSWILSSIEVTCSQKDDLIYLPCNLCVEKNKNIVTFSFKKRSKVSIFLLLIYIGILLLGLMAATYWAVYYLSIADLNKDIDKDGVADINIDINADDKAEINVDVNNDNKPDINIDYKGNRKARFNIDNDGDEKADFNLVNDASTDAKRKVCTLNCDVNGDGWPDTNIDIDGDGRADLDIDLDKDGIPDLNLDLDGDEKPDLMIDDDYDNICDRKCLNSKELEQQREDIKPTGSTVLTGEPQTEIGTGNLIITYLGDGAPTLGALPNDMSEHRPIEPRQFRIQNDSNSDIIYRLVWTNVYNDFETEHLQYRLEGTNGGASTDWQAVPKGNGTIINGIRIPAESSQTYTLSFRFVGIWAEQNIDQGKTFGGIVTAEFAG